MHDKIPTPHSVEYWDCLYNHKQICETLLHEGEFVASMLFRQRAQHLLIMLSEMDTDKTEAIFIMLTSLNRSLYAYVQFYLNISLTECCYQCRVHAHNVKDDSSFIEAGAGIIECYSRNLWANKQTYHDFQQACVYIQNHLEDDLSISQLCAMLHVSKSCLCRMFKDLTGSTFCEYLKQLRLSRARTLLTSTQMPIEDISAACGFRSSAYFSTVFKGELGMTPSVFRQTYS